MITKDITIGEVTKWKQDALISINAFLWILGFPSA